jgi:hypothetical protein
MAEGRIQVADKIAVSKAHAIYTPFMLAFYDMLVHVVSNRIAWRCPRQRLLQLYNLSANHLEAGAGTGFSLDKTGDGRLDRLVLLDINRHCLDRSARRLVRFAPERYKVNLLAPIELELPPSPRSASPMCCIACRVAWMRSSPRSTICGR